MTIRFLNNNTQLTLICIFKFLAKLVGTASIWGTTVSIITVWVKDNVNRYVEKLITYALEFHQLLMAVTNFTSSSIFTHSTFKTKQKKKKKQKKN